MLVHLSLIFSLMSQNFFKQLIVRLLWLQIRKLWATSLAENTGCTFADLFQSDLARGSGFTGKCMSTFPFVHWRLARGTARAGAICTHCKSKAQGWTQYNLVHRVQAGLCISRHVSILFCLRGHAYEALSG
jgi:hypothetical protein